jgi:hypothetical protein
VVAVSGYFDWMFREDVFWAVSSFTRKCLLCRRFSDSGLGYGHLSPTVAYSFAEIVRLR